MADSIFKTVKNTIKHWWLLLIVGLIFVLIGAWTLATPISSYLTLSIIFSVSFLIAGIFEIIFAISNRKELDGWGWTLVYGILSFLVGWLLIANPGISIVTLPIYLGFIVLFRSIMGIGNSLDMKSYGVSDWGGMMFISILGLLFSFILLWNPGFAGLTLVIWTGLALIAVGGYSIYYSIKLKKLHKAGEKIAGQVKAALQ
jgi:uncharacterized membrane protein HdeD (DUF308 family)